MRVIIIEEKDVLALIDQLRLVKLQGTSLPRADANKPPTLEEVHRAFHYVVVRWAQDQGASCAR